jgi:nucleotidyltransferase/DNA polymerase involved in DNA repair
LLTLESSDDTPVTLDAPREIRVDTEPVRLLGTSTIVWRIVPAETGAFVVTTHSGASAVSKTILVGNGPARRSPLRAQADFERQLLYPSESVIPAESAITSIAVGYPEGRIDLFGWRVHWLIAYAAFSLLAALLLSRWLGVTI